MPEPSADSRQQTAAMEHPGAQGRSGAAEDQLGAHGVVIGKIGPVLYWIPVVAFEDAQRALQREIATIAVDEDLVDFIPAGGVALGELIVDLVQREPAVSAVLHAEGGEHLAIGGGLAPARVGEAWARSAQGTSARPRTDRKNA
jgi:hypothetical protein